MGFPYQCLSTIGESTLLCGSKGTNIYTFDIASCTLLSSWSHPFSRKGGLRVGTDEAENSGGQESEQPPSKKRKVESNSEDKLGDEGPEKPAGEPEAADGERPGKNRKPKQPAPRPQEQPFVILIAATSDGKHVVAVTGTDKTVWVFEHDAMPKRPNAIRITADGKTILCADKFGDVYSLPLVPSTTTTSEASGASTPASTPAAQSTFTLKANEFTVHSARNLRALEDQKKALQLQAAKDTPKEAPSFEHELILGHVSMITALATASSGGKPYILTADRDEHIRVSRGIPQAYVIENFCLGHKAFISALCIPDSQPELLVSGGGDNELFLWDWLAGKLLYRVDLLVRVQEVVPGALKIAVTGLHSYHTERGSSVIAMCERVPALFVFEVRGNALVYVQTLNLSGNPLDVVVISEAENQPSRLAVSVDPVIPAIADDSEMASDPVDQSLLFFSMEGDSWAAKPDVPLPAIETSDENLARPELDKVLYAVESLRKTNVEDADDGEHSTKGSVAGQEDTDSMDVSEAA
ncbi:hypothetical protein DL766_005280 [Monosporascus sp. MC13-8B]|uniref:Transfer RNA methyltransferase 82 n=1 Tax=Monosporascus cannonballus TaxID=155416 RepID=A0ABY0HBX6_9PEZI|nr:hypothetical protein DL762_004437 [Monosporascus cannonballus]RYO87904.1 hypothetical protein DL763_006210 [Monosporascus cannonballus]RYP29650.1 hypothetical protein DL766_005280 [Monosporascus sp. MC13-8B]